MLLGWLDARRATDVGIELADLFAPPTVANSAARNQRKSASVHTGAAQREFLHRAEREIRPLRLNFYKKAKLANSFKWRLLENGVERHTADEATQTLVAHLSLSKTHSAVDRDSPAVPPTGSPSRKPEHLLALAAKHQNAGAYAAAITCYQSLLELHPRHTLAMNNLGAALCKLGRYEEAEQHFRRAVGIKPEYADAHNNLGTLLRHRGQLAAAENSLRRALKLKPQYRDARIGLAMTLLSAGRPEDAKVHFDKALKIAPRDADALLGIGQIAAMEGNFDTAEALFRRALEVRPNFPGAWAAMVGLRKMTPSDGAWLVRAEQIVGDGIEPPEEAAMCFAIGKYCDDVADYGRAFQSYKRANDLMKSIADGYDRVAHSSFVDSMISAYTRDNIARSTIGSSESSKPVFVVGMMRSGTSLAEQIIASHPDARGAGELEFWSAVVRRHGATVAQGPLDESMRRKLSAEYLQALAQSGGDAPRIIDKTPVNSDYLGLIYTVFPRARIIYMRRNPVDSCLSCYFQQFSSSLDFTFDLSDLAHYYRQHQRLISHWRAVLPPGSILEVPYAELVADPQGWTRKMLEFLGLGWDERCLDFQDTKRMVATASTWQVRQKIYSGSVERWRNYAKFIGPLRDLMDLDS